MCKITIQFVGIAALGEDDMHVHMGRFVDRIQYFLLVDCIQVLEMLWLMRVLERLCQWHRE
jgi:hypothetical protein